jgi:hypothetical protein
MFARYIAVARLFRLILPAVVLALLLPAAASAQSPAIVTIDGNPLKIYASADGGVQVSVDGAAASEFFPPFAAGPSGNAVPSQTANSGFGLILNPDPNGGGQRFGKFIAGNVPAPDAGPTLTPGNPATISTTWTYKDASGAPLVRVTQLISYMQGQRQFDTTYTVQNVSTGTSFSFRANVAGDLAIRGSDSGVGFLVPGPPRFMGGLNQDVGAAGGFVEETPPWSKFESNQLGAVAQAASDGTLGGGFDNSLSTTSADNAAGVQWDNHSDPSAPLGPGQSATYSLGWRFVDTLGLSPVTAAKQTGEEASVTVSVGDVNGVATGGQTVGYTIEGPNSQTGSVKTDAQGHATIAWVGGAKGQDTLTAFVDTNGNGIRDAGEPQATATVDWTGADTPPVLGQSAGVRPVAGTVKIKLPKGFPAGKAKRLGLQGAAGGFVPLTSAKSIPIGSTLDTTKGIVQLFTATSQTQNKFQTGNFNGGQFKLGQTTKNPLTTLTMGGGNLNGCHIGIPTGGAAAAHVRRLAGNAHGRYRTRGRNSSATVRGTQWTMTDTCAGTLTSVKRGSVVVRDFRLRKNRVVRAGHKYLARSFKLTKHHP